MKKELRYFVKVIAVMATTVSTGLFIGIMCMGYSFFDAFVYFIAFVVAQVPEGLLLTLTVCLTLTAKKMAKKNCLVKNLQGIETLGATNVICSDKTGTLTQNKMTVAHLFYDGYLRDTMDMWNDSWKTDPGFIALCRVGVLCLRAEFKPHQENVPVSNRLVDGDASETAILRCMEMKLGNTDALRRRNAKLLEIPFNSTNKYQLSIHKSEEGTLMVFKGAPERVLERCSTIQYRGSDHILSGEFKKALHRGMLDISGMGERVLGFADLVLDPVQYPQGYKFDTRAMNFPQTGLRFCGLMSMIDPPRPGVPEAVRKCKTAGIKVYMVTGDHPVTAMAIARKVGIISKENLTLYDLALRLNMSVSRVPRAQTKNLKAAIVTGTDLKTMETAKLQDIILRYDELVFARTSPQQKLKIVEAIQQLHQVVAVTGDGVNDSPALKRADIGVAMGISGSDVSKEAADMIIMDDDFTSIVQGIEEGRLIFDNLKKSIAFILTSNVPECIPCVLFLTFNLPPVLSAMAILAINVGTDLIPGIAYAYEKPESDIMKVSPRNPKTDRLVNWRLYRFVWQCGLIQACAGFTNYFITLAIYGFYWDILPGMRERWVSPYVNDIVDSYGQEWTYRERMVLTRKCYSAYFLSIVFTQVIDAIICKTRRLSVFQQKMTNHVMNFGIIYEIIFGICVCYTPGLRRVLQFEPVTWHSIVPCLPFGIVMFVFDEVRKYLLRHNPGGCVERETYY